MKKTPTTLNPLSTGGGSNTPPVDTNSIVFDKPKLKKRVLIDWLSATFDFVNVYSNGENFYTIDYDDPKFKQLVKFFGWRLPTVELPRLNKVVRGYKNGYQLGEHIRILFGGEHTKNSSDRYSINLLMSGEACREFENFMDGNWNDLLTFLLTNGATIKRIDIAIDDFDGEEISIYEIEDYVRKHHFTSPMYNTQVIYTSGKVDGIDISTGFSITFGSPSSNQLQIYDKKLERMQKGSPDIHSDIWYRYEMRFVDHTAQAIAETYTVAVEQNYSPVFMELARSNLYRMLDIKEENPNDTNLSRWKTLDKWTNFLDGVSKINLKTNYKVESTMIKKKLWFESSLHKFTAQMIAYQGLNNFGLNNYKTALKGFEDMFGDEKALSMINNGLQALGQKPLSWDDIQEIMESLKYYVENEE